MDAIVWGFFMGAATTIIFFVFGMMFLETEDE